MTMIATRDGVRAAEVVVPFDDETPDIARLTFDNGVQNLTLTGAAAAEVMMEATFGEPLPQTWTAGGTVHVEYPLGARFLRRMGDNTIALNSQLPWSVDVHGGMSHLVADLTGVAVRSLACYTGAAHSRIELGRPTAPSTLRFTSVSELHLTRPAGVPVRLEITKSATRLEFDGTSLGAISGGFTNQTDGYDPDEPGYLIILSGSAARLTIS